MNSTPTSIEREALARIAAARRKAQHLRRDRDPVRLGEIVPSLLDNILRRTSQPSRRGAA